MVFKMINEEETFKNFGYYSTDLKIQSNKKVIAVCESCKKERVLAFQDYRELCKSCARNGTKRPDLAKRNRKNIRDKSPVWNPNLTVEDREIGRRYPEYYEWRKNIYIRDDFTCQICGDNSGGILNAHHLEGYANNPDLRITLENGVTLCKSCHNNFHHRYGYNNTKEQFIEFIKLYGL